MDELDWLKVWNEVYGKRWDLAPMTVEEMRLTERSPDFEAERARGSFKHVLLVLESRC